MKFTGIQSEYPFSQTSGDSSREKKQVPFRNASLPAGLSFFSLLVAKSKTKKLQGGKLSLHIKELLHLCLLTVEQALMGVGSFLTPQEQKQARSSLTKSTRGEVSCISR